MSRQEHKAPTLWEKEGKCGVENPESSGGCSSPAYGNILPPEGTAVQYGFRYEVSIGILLCCGGNSSDKSQGFSGLLGRAVS